MKKGSYIGQELVFPSSHKSAKTTLESAVERGKRRERKKMDEGRGKNKMDKGRGKRKMDEGRWKRKMDKV